MIYVKYSYLYIKIKNTIRMKRFAWIIGLLLCTICTVQAKERVIERPPFLAWNSPSIEFDKIVINDTATTVYVKAFYRPKYWIKIATGSFLKDNNGVLYPIRKGIGITLDKEFWMPDSGKAEFQLLFPPIQSNATSLDFSEGDFDGAYKIWGIQLDKKAFNKAKLPKEIKIAKNNTKAPLPEPIAKYEKAILKGRILDFAVGMPNEGEIYSLDLIKGNGRENSIKIQDDGTFYYETNILSVTSYMLSLPMGRASFLLAPGETTSIVINLRETARKQSHLRQEEKSHGKEVYYGGYLAGLQQELADYDEPIFNLMGNSNEEHQQIMKEINGKTPAEYKAYLLARLPECKKQIMQSKRSYAYKELANIDLELTTSLMIMDTERCLKSAHIIANDLKAEDVRKYYSDTRIEIPEGYYESLKDFATILSPKACYSKRYNEFVTLANNTNILDILGESADYLAQNMKTSRLGALIKEFQPLTEEQKADVATMPQAYSEAILAANDVLLKKIEINKKKTGFTINEAGEVADEDLFPSIISKFRGHTLLVDFWATWCGPCRMANKAMIPMKEELKDKDIIYIYITGETSPMGTWQNMIPDIHGEHFRVTNKQWSYLMQNFNIRGVPTYFVIDREGNITHRESGFSGAENMKKKLMQALEK